MSITSSQIFHGASRLDAPLLRLLDSYVRGDFDLLAGDIMASKRPLVVRGFTLSTFQIGGLPKQLTLVVRDGVALHYGATASGTLFRVPPGREVEVLDPQTNPRVSGSYGASRANYVGLDIVREVDVTTKEQLAFWDPQLEKEQLKRVPLAKTQDYRIIITDVPFEQTTLLPLWIVITNSAGAVSELRDARPFLGSLSSGGSDPDLHHAYAWPQGRRPLDASRGGDKAIGSLKDSLDAMMSRIREIAGGEYWYSAVSDRNVKMVRSGTTFSNGEYFEWDGTHLHWRGLAFLLPNSTGMVNEIADQTSNQSGLTNLADGDCLYVDLDYSSDKTGGSALVARRTPLQSLGVGDRDRSRAIIAWRRGSSVFVRDGVFSVGSEPFPSLRDVLTSQPLFRRVRARCTTSPTLVIRALNSFFVDDGGVWVELTHPGDEIIDVSTLISLVANTRYYVYAYKSVIGSVAFEISTTAPSADLRWKNGDASRAFITTLYTDNSSGITRYIQTNSTISYRDSIGYSVVEGNRVLNNGTSTTQATAITISGPVPAIAATFSFGAEINGSIGDLLTVGARDGSGAYADVAIRAAQSHSSGGKFQGKLTVAADFAAPLAYHVSAGIASVWITEFTV